MGRPGATLSAFTLLVIIAAGVFGVSGLCSDGCGDAMGCASLCLDCACCPNGTSTPGIGTLRIHGLALLDAAFHAPSRPHSAVPPEEILHVPKPVLI